MNDADRQSLQKRVLVLAPKVEDGDLTRAMLARAGIACVDCADQVQVCEHLTVGAGAVLIAEEAVPGRGGCLADWLGRQPLWSDVPVLVMAPAGADSPAVAQALEELGNVTLVERPTQVASLVSAVRSALRSRRRQYQLRDQLVQGERVADQLKLAMAVAQAGSWQIDLTTGEFSVSDRAIELHGLPPGMPFDLDRARACVHPDDRASVDAALQLTMVTGSPYRTEHRVLHPDGSVRWVSSHAERRGEGDHTCIIGLVQDVTERKEAEGRLRASEERLRLAVRDTGVLVYTTDADLRYTWLANPHPAFRPEDVLGRRDEDLLPAEQAAPLTAIKQRVLDSGVGETGEVAFSISGRQHAYNLAVEPLHDSTGGVIGVTAAAMNISAVRQAEEALRASEHRLRLTLEAAAIGLWEWDLATNVVNWSPECYTIHGIKEGEFDGTAAEFDGLLYPADRSRVWATVRAAVDGRTKYECEFRIVRPDGEIRWVANTGRAAYDHGRPVKMVGTLTDITHRKQAEAERESAQTTLTTVVERCPFGIYIVDDEFRILRVNTASENVAFVNVRPLIGRPYDEVVRIVWPEPVSTDIIDIFRQTLATGEPYFSKDFVSPRADIGHRESYEWEVHRIDLPSGRHGVVCYYFDATKLRHAEAAVRDGEQRMRLATATTGVGIWEWNVVTGVIRWDAQMFQIYGIAPTPDGCVRYDTWREAVLPEDLPRQEEILQETILRRGSSSREFRIRRASDGECRVVQAAETVRIDAHGQVEWVLGTNLDITEPKQAEDELRRLAAELTEADRRKDLFLATLAHELRNPLAPLRYGLQVMRLAGASGTVEQARSMMDRQLTQLVRLVDDLLDVSRVTRGKLELRMGRVELRAVIGAAVETSRPTLEQAGLEFTVVVPEEPIFVDGDAARLAQVVSNLLSNSAKYTHWGGHVRLMARVEGGTAVVSVKDDGIGIPPALLGRVFEMFTQVDRTLEKTTGGLGIGLSLVKGLLEMHGGTIEAMSDGEGMGSEFLVRLPVAMAVVAGPNRPNRGTGEVVPAGIRRILVVDDNVDSADSLGHLLEMLGNEVRTANDGEAGIEVAAQFRPDVVLMDIGMPKLNGYEAARRIRQHPWGRGMLLVALTGWGHEGDRKKSADAGFDHHLVKPVEVDALLKVMA